MAQVSVYIPDDIERELRQRAKRSGKSLSALLTELVSAELRPSRWPAGFMDLAGSWEGDFRVPDDPPPDEVELARSRNREARRRR